MSYNQKPPGAGGSGMGGGVPPNGPNNSQQVAKTLAGIQQQMQNLVHGQNALPQTSQAELNVFLQQQRFQNMLKQQQLLHFQMQHQQQQQQHQQQQKDRGGGGVGIGSAGGGSGGEPLALTRTPAAADLLNKTFPHQQQQPNGSAAAPNAALNQFQQQLQALPPNIIHQLQTLQFQMQQHQQQQQQQQQHQHQQQQQHQQQHPSQATPAQHHPTQQQPQSSTQQQQQPQSLLTAHQQQLHGQFQQQQQKALQQFQQSLRYFPTAAPSQPTTTPQSTTASNKIVTAATTQPPSQAPTSTAIGNQQKAPNLPPSTQITPVPSGITPVGLIPGIAAQQQVAKSIANSTPVTTSASGGAGGGGGNTIATVGAKHAPTPSISLLPAKAGSATAVPTAAHQQSKFGAGKTSPIVSAMPPPFPTHFQKPSVVPPTITNIAPTTKAGAVPTGTVAMTTSASTATGPSKSPQQSVNPVPLTKQALPAPTPTSQLGAATSGTTVSSTSAPGTAAVTANSGMVCPAEQTNAPQKDTNSKPASPVAGNSNTISAIATDKNINSATAEKLETTKSAELAGKIPAQMKEDQSAVNSAKPASAEKKIYSAAAKELNAAAATDTKVGKPGDTEDPVEKINKPGQSIVSACVVSSIVGGGSDGGGNVDDTNPEKNKPSITKEEDSQVITASKEETETKVVEENKNANKLESAEVTTTKDINLHSTGEHAILKVTKDTENSCNIPGLLGKKDAEEKRENLVKEVTEQISRAPEKSDNMKAKLIDTVDKISGDIAENKTKSVEKKESLIAVNDLKTVVASSTPVDTKLKTAPPKAAENSTEPDKRQTGKVAVAEKQKDEKTKNTKLEKTPASLPATAAAVEQPTQSNINNHANTKSTKLKATEAAPDSTNSLISEANTTQGKRSGRQTTKVPKSIEKPTTEKSEKVSSSSRSRKSKNGVSSSSSNSSAAADVTGSPAIPKLEQGPSTSGSDRKSSRHRLKTIPFQSPLPELAYITKLSASEASNSPKPMSIEDKLIVFYKNEYMAVRNAEGTFYLCQTMQNVYRTSPRISIRWLSEDPNNSAVYIPDFYDHTDIECVLTTVELKRVDKGHLSLPKKEQTRIESILKKAIDVEKGLVPRPELTEENPDGLDISLYKDESQIEKKSATSTTPTGIRKSRRSVNDFGTPSTSKSGANTSTAASSTKGRKRGRASSTGVTANDSGVKSSAKKRKMANKRKSKSKKATTTDEENDSTDDSDAEYKPNQKNTGSASKASPRAQRSPLAKARAASPISSTTARTKDVLTKSTSTASSRGERANKRKAAADRVTPTTENAPTAPKKAGGSASGTSTASTPNASKSTITKSKTQDGAIEANSSSTNVKKISAAAETTDMVSSTTNTNNIITAENTTGVPASSSGNGANSNNRPTRSRK